MKNLALSWFAVLLLLTAFSACSHGPPKPKYVEEKNQAKFATTHAFTEPPEKVLRAGRAVLDRLTHESTPQASDAVRSDDNSVFTGWVYGTASRDKYVQYDDNGAPRRKDLAVRRIYGYTVTPSLSGSRVELSVEEEIQRVDLETGKPKDWKRVEPEQAAYDMLLHKLQEAIRAE
jgi:hypothetical protein